MKLNCFIAYPSNTPAIVETIERAVKEINDGKIVNITLWTDLINNGSFIIDCIADEIDKSDLFICDITYFNKNVLYELGYAIATGKKIYILFNKALNNSGQDFKEFGLLSTLGYSEYENSVDIVQNFYQYIQNDSVKTIFDRKIKPMIMDNPKKNLFYMKSPNVTEASRSLSLKIDELKRDITVVVDDKNEVNNNPLDFYIKQIFDSYMVVIHLISNEMGNYKFYNEKSLFIAGIAMGLNKPLLLLAHDPFEKPVDLDNIIKIHKTATECTDIAEEWLNTKLHEYGEEKKTEKKHITNEKQKEELKHIDLGTYIAEQESDNLIKYFIETESYRQALVSNCAIFIGRKGSGKTANLVALKHKLSKDKRNYVCDISPVGYEIEGIIHMIKMIRDKSEKGYLIESFWKFLIYTELMKNEYEVLRHLPAYRTKNEAEECLWEFVEKNQDIILPEFSIKLETVVEKLKNIDNESLSIKDQRLKISEKLHKKVLTEIRNILSNVLAGKNKVVILIDNLDKAWTRDNDFSVLGSLLFGLLEVASRITHDFSRIDINKEKVNLSLIIFLRSDIYSKVIKYAQEKDKLNIYNITWNDKSVLLNVIEMRFLVACSSINCGQEIWGKYFCDKVKNINVQEYILEHILPKPRDILFFVQVARINAINHGHIKIEENDIIQANKEYSKHAIDTIVVESRSEYNQDLEELLYGFLGENEIVDINVIKTAMGKCGIEEEKLEDVIDLLFELSFLGLKTRKDEYQFLTSLEEKTKIKRFSEKYIERYPQEKRLFKINTPFHDYLEIEITEYR